MMDLRFWIMAWRFLTGAHMHGRQITNATWRKRGTMPRSHINWWTQKPRFHRMGLRWAMLIVPILWIELFVHFHYWTVIVSIGLSPYIVHYLWHKVQKAGTVGISVPAQFERRLEENKVTDLVFEPLNQEKKVGRK